MAPPADTPEAPNGAQNASDQQISDQEYDMLMNYPENLDFYSLLALPRDPPPTEAQIRSAYHSLTLSFHPDKQAPELRDAANTHYNRIRTAYETLIDPKKRAVYDMMGEDAVRQEWGAGGAMGVNGEAEQQQVGVKAMDVAQFRRWFLMTMKKRERKALDQMVQAKVRHKYFADFVLSPSNQAIISFSPLSVSSCNH
jgi:DnaJ family protein C protein 11